MENNAEKEINNEIVEKQENQEEKQITNQLPKAGIKIKQGNSIIAYY